MVSVRTAGPLDGIRAVDRALWVLDVLTRNEQCSITEIAAAIGVHKSTASRLLSTLERSDLVERAAPSGKYQLGIGVLRLAGARSSQRLDFVREALPSCRRLAVASGETVNIAALSERSALYLEQVAGPSPLHTHNWVGQTTPLHATANGKVLLAWLTPGEVSRLVEPLDAFTSATLTSATALIQELQLTRQRGFATAIDELEPGLTAIAAPIRNIHDDVVWSISVSGPTFRLGEREVADTAPLVVEAANDLTRCLGWGLRA